MSSSSNSSNSIVVTTGPNCSVSIPHQVTGQLSVGEQFEIILPNGEKVVIRKTKCPEPEPAQIILPKIVLAPPFYEKVHSSSGVYDAEGNDLYDAEGNDLYDPEGDGLYETEGNDVYEPVYDADRNLTYMKRKEGNGLYDREFDYIEQPTQRIVQ
jgi:hypothetical protein